jgi:hypothetical protein
VAACQRRVKDFPIVHIARWRDGLCLGLDDGALLMACAEAGLVLVSFDRATLVANAVQSIRLGENVTGLVLFRRGVKCTDYGDQAELLTEFWRQEGHAWDWLNRFVYLPIPR